jgi:hypothetical protein
MSCLTQNSGHSLIFLNRFDGYFFGFVWFCLVFSDCSGAFGFGVLDGCELYVDPVGPGAAEGLAGMRG